MFYSTLGIQQNGSFLHNFQNKTAFLGHSLAIHHIFGKISLQKIKYIHLISLKVSLNMLHLQKLTKWTLVIGKNCTLFMIWLIFVISLGNITCLKTNIYPGIIKNSRKVLISHLFDCYISFCSIPRTHLANFWKYIILKDTFKGY